MTVRRVQVKPGERFGTWELVELRGMGAQGQRWLCKCLCGAELVKALAVLRRQKRLGRYPRCASCARDV
jgi:hypothetical protein